jgi:ATP-binding cassette subfamily B protein
MERVGYVADRLGPYAQPHRLWLVYGVLAALAVVACRLAFPWPLRGVMELLFNSGQRSGPLLAAIPGELDPVVVLAGSFVAIALLQGGAELIQRFSFARFAIRAVHDARAAAVSTLLDGSPPSKRDRDPGDLLARVVGDTARVKAGVKGVLIHVAQNGLLLIGVVVLLMLIDFKLGAIFGAGLLTTTVVAWVGTRIIAQLARQHRKKEGLYAAKVHRALLDAETSAGFK